MNVVAILLWRRATLLSAVAFAHTDAGETSGFTHGFGHPIGGFDHVFAMVAVGVLAHQIGGRALWLVPMTFVLLMAVGGALGILGIVVPFVEVDIALSIIALGTIVAAGMKAPIAIFMGLVGFFAIFHGHAHGMEMPEDAGALAFGVGFMLATTWLQVSGVGLGFFMGRIADARGPIVVRSAGGIAAIAGAAILAGRI